MVKSKDNKKTYRMSEVLRAIYRDLNADTILKRKFIKQIIISITQGALHGVGPLLRGNMVNAATNEGLRNPEVAIWGGLDFMTNYIDSFLDVQYWKTDDDINLRAQVMFEQFASNMYVEEDPGFRVWNPMPSFSSASQKAKNAMVKAVRAVYLATETGTTLAASGATLFSISPAVATGLLAYCVVNCVWSVTQTQKNNPVRQRVWNRSRDSSNRLKDIADTNNVSAIQRSANQDIYHGIIDRESEHDQERKDRLTKRVYSFVNKRTAMNFLADISAATAAYLIAIRSGQPVGTFMTVMQNASLFVRWTNNVGRSISEIYSATADYDSAMKILNHRPKIVDKEGAVEIDVDELKKKPPMIEFHRVSHHYFDKDDKPQENILTDFSLKIKGGEKVALVGETGSGKTTMLSLLLREYEPQQGEVWVDGHRNDMITLNSLRNAIRYIPQEDGFLNRSVRENLRMVKPYATDEEMENALSKAMILETIVKKDGLDTEMGSAGTAFSGGEKHRIGLARAFLCDAPVMIFDEPTSDIDVHTAKAIISNIKKATKGRTSLIVTHDPTVAIEFDRIIVMKNGKIVDDGKPDDLLATNGAFSKMMKTHIGKIEKHLSTIEQAKKKVLVKNAKKRVPVARKQKEK